MKTRIVGKNFEVTKKIETSVEKRFGRLSKLVPSASDLVVTIERVAGGRQFRVDADMDIPANGMWHICSSAESDSPHKAITTASESMIRSVKKRVEKDRLFDSRSIRTMHDSDGEDNIEEVVD